MGPLRRMWRLMIIAASVVVAASMAISAKNPDSCAHASNAPPARLVLIAPTRLVMDATPMPRARIGVSSAKEASAYKAGCNAPVQKPATASPPNNTANNPVPGGSVETATAITAALANVTSDSSTRTKPGEHPADDHRSHQSREAVRQRPAQGRGKRKPQPGEHNGYPAADAVVQAARAQHAKPYPGIHPCVVTHQQTAPAFPLRL